MATPIAKRTPEEQQEALTELRREFNKQVKEDTLRRASQERVEDLKDLSFKLLYREVGDGALAKMAHINSLARRVSTLEGTNDNFLEGPVKERELVSDIKSIANVGDIAADEVFLVAKKVPV
mgnify:CR=1 FL=1|tara:strand:- start:5401 stop:5766 length:366 start_codon:yes stop_codon:yes gene_type:complete